MNNLPNFFIRRFNERSFEEIMKRASIYVFWETKNKEEFKTELAGSTVDTFLHQLYNLDSDDVMTKKQMDNIIDFIIDKYGPLMDMYYKNLKKDYPLS
jgi:hypothetical protein